MSYDTKAQKNRPEPLQSGVALSTLVFVEEEEHDAETTERELEGGSLEQDPSA